MKKLSILVTGDPAIDRFEYTIPKNEVTVGNGPDSGDDSNLPNWHRYERIAQVALPGGCLSLADFVKAATGVEVDRPQIGPSLTWENLSPNEVIHSFASLKPVKDDDTRWEIERFKGYSGPADTAPGVLAPGRTTVRWPQTGSARLIVVGDSGNGFRAASHLFPSPYDTETTLIYKMHAPLQRPPCDAFFRGMPAENAGPSAPTPAVAIRPENMVMIVSIDDLRKLKEVNISCGLSWERTACELLHQIRLNPELEWFSYLKNLIVVCNTDGAFIYHQGAVSPATLVFDPERWEGGFAKETERSVWGLMNAFTAALTASVFREGLEAIEKGTICGLNAMRRLLCAGYRKTGAGMKVPLEEIFPETNLPPSGGGSQKPPHAYACIQVPISPCLDEPDPEGWRILDTRTKYTRELVAADLACRNRHRVMTQVPQIRFGKLITSDRQEIESYSAIRKLIAEYQQAQKVGQPLCVAVFGAPGAGKSFGVKQVAQSLKIPKDAIDSLNLSQVNSEDELNAGFHRVRDLCLSGRLPLFFFDEFDTGRLKWLKSFLAPMQDGEFTDRGTVYHIGQAIFIFAGGTCSRFAEFSSPKRLENQEYKDKKLPDFISRLRGFVDIMGPNPRSAANGHASANKPAPPGKDSARFDKSPCSAGQAIFSDPSYIIRRGRLLYTLLSNLPQASGLLHGQERRLHIDEGLLRALLKTPRYKHGVRSMEAILKMSRIHGKQRFDKSDLPSREQLALHVDVEDFFFFLERERFAMCPVPGGDMLSAEDKLVEDLARASHAMYIRARRRKGEAVKVPENFDDLPKEKKESNRDQARDIPHKLKTIGMWMRPYGTSPSRSPIVTAGEIDRLARMEHCRWMREQRHQGITHHEDLQEFDRLPPAVQEYDREIVSWIPALLEGVGLEIYRMEEVDEVVDPQMIVRMAEEVHARYCREREKEGETAANNANLVPFAELSEDIRRSNLDNAAHIPTKLRAIGYGIRPVHTGRPTEVLRFSQEEIEIMARMEHDRWMWDRRLSGWTFAPGEKNVEQKTSPSLVPYDELTEKIKDYDRQTVSAIPEILAGIGYEAFKIKEAPHPASDAGLRA